jgi:hypothetical protein
MSTRSFIGIVQEDGTVKGVYCHSDGYPSNQMPLLTENYTVAKKVDELVSLGDMSQLDRRICPPKNSKHSFDHRRKGVCVYYGRDRGEDSNAIKPTVIERKKLASFIKRGWYQYAYLFKDGKWKAYEVTYPDKGGKRFRKMTERELKAAIA